MNPRIVDTRLISSTGSIARLPEPTLPEVAFAGRSNVGKSSLLNALSGRKGLFKVSNTPGRTRTIVHVEARLDTGQKLYWVDLPGYGYARASHAAQQAWAEFIQTYLQTRSTLRLVVILVDCRRGPEAEEQQLLSFLQSVGVPAIIAATKVDRVPRSKQRALLDRLHRESQRPIVGTAIPGRIGIDALLATIVRHIKDSD